MEIRNIRHKGLRAFAETNNAKGLHKNAQSKIADILAFLIEIESIDEVFDLHKFKPHQLSGPP